MSHRTLESNILSIEKFFQETDAFVVPEYQRSYQWRETHIEKLFSDILSSIALLVDSPSIDGELRFLGTIITITDRPNRFGSGPRSLRQIIDGQQRITTLMLMSIVIEKKLDNLYASFKAIEPEVEIQKLLHINIERLKTGLRNIYSFSVRSIMTGTQLFPAIVREEQDRWDAADIGYQSPVVNLIAKYLKNPGELSTDDANVNTVIACMNKLLDNVGDNDYEKLKSNESFEVYDLGKLMLRIGRQIYLDDGGRLADLTPSQYVDQRDVEFVRISRIVVFTSYLLSRCFVNHINSESENSAFDMFIGLNTTGIPLSSVETFRAHALKEARNLHTNLGDEVREKINNVFSTGKYSIESLFDGVVIQEKKDKRIKEYVTSFALYYSGGKVGYNPNQQREYLRKIFNKNTHSDNNDERKFKQLIFLEHLHTFTRFQSTLDDNPPEILSENTLSSHSELRETALLAKKFLGDVDLSISFPLWARVYEKFARENSNASTAHAIEFAEIVSATAAFYSLWRAVAGVNGLPEVYRTWMSESFSVLMSEEVDVNSIKKKLLTKLESMRMSPYDFTDRSKWVDYAARELRMSSSADLCRFILLWTSHNTTPDSLNPGLMQVSERGYTDYARHNNWKSTSLKTIEHIAPKKPETSSKWETGFYGVDSIFDSIGNLVLLPLDLNTSLSNRDWDSKLYYYQYVVEETQDKRRAYVDEKRSQGVNLDIETLSALRRADYFAHLQPIVAYGSHSNNPWNVDIVKQRSIRILEIFHERMMSFLKK